MTIQWKAGMLKL